VPVAFLDRARAASRSVVRIIDGDRRELGSGVMISPRLLLTNNHVIASEAEARDRIVQFDYELSAERDEVESEAPVSSRPGLRVPGDQ